MLGSFWKFERVLSLAMLLTGKIRLCPLSGVFNFPFPPFHISCLENILMALLLSHKEQFFLHHKNITTDAFLIWEQSHLSISSQFLRCGGKTARISWFLQPFASDWTVTVLLGLFQDSGRIFISVNLIFMKRLSDSDPVKSAQPTFVSVSIRCSLMIPTFGVSNLCK